MARPKPLTHPPIVEALLDLRTSIAGEPEMFKALAETLTEEFPTKQQQRNFEAKIEIRDGKLVSPRVDSSAFGGVRVANVAETIYVQFRPDGFTLNNMKVYMGGDQLIDKALTLWPLLVERARPESVSRVALRYINRLELPLTHGDEFTKYLTAPPEFPQGAPQLVSEFISRIVGQDEQRQATAVVIQQLKKEQTGARVAVTVDVDVFRTGNFSVEAPALRKILNALRVFKNETFFSLLTDETVRLYE